MSASGLSTAAEEAIERKLNVLPESMNSESLDENFQINWTLSVIESRDFKKVALQFPDELLHISVPIYQKLRTSLSQTRDIYVLADTTYGSCCVDEIAAQHVNAEVVVHYGHACRSPTSRLPVIYVFGRRPIDPPIVAQALVNASDPTSKDILTLQLYADVVYEYQAAAVVDALKGLLPSHFTIHHDKLPAVAEPTSQDQVKTSEAPAFHVAALGRSEKRPNLDSKRALIFWLGPEGMALTNLLMTHSGIEVWSYDPSNSSTRLQSGYTNKLLMRRYAAMHKARDADVFGILIGTLGVARYAHLITSIRSLLSHHHKKAYVVSVGKLNPSKLANFSEVKCFVLVACPESSVIDSKDFLQPIVTPFELLMAMNTSADWDGRYLLNFDSVLSDIENNNATYEEDASDPEEPRFSLVNGAYRSVRHYGKPAPQDYDEIGAVSLRNSDATVARFMESAGGEFLQNRTFKGLEQFTGMDAPGGLEQGRSGIARGYGEASGEP